MIANYSLMNHCTRLLRCAFIALIATSTHLFATDLSVYSSSELEKLEKEFTQLINQSDSVERNPLANQYINHLGATLAHFGHVKAQFFIVKSSEINAFAGPGGYIGINTQLILTTNNESELAAVMAHELAHVKLHHLYDEMDHQKQMRIPELASLLASAALGVLNPTVGLGAMMASASGFTQDSINFTRAKEKEADRIGIAMLIKAGFNPKGMAQFFKKMQENMRYYYTANIPAILRTHPMDEERIAEAENRTAKLPKAHYKDSLDYFLFKELIRVSVTANSRQLSEFYEHHCPIRFKVKLNTNPHFSSACQYGYALASIKMSQFQKAIDLLQILNTELHDSPYTAIALSEAELGANKYQAAQTRLEALFQNYPDNTAALMAYADCLIRINQPQKAAALLLKGSRIHKNNLPVCQALARAQAASHQQSYAYFTQAQCLLPEGQKRGAMSQLKTAQALSKSDAYLNARIKAKIEEIKLYQ
jgi:predicted Zn-dependent protease